MEMNMSPEPALAPAVAPGRPECPQCHDRMTVRQVSPTLREIDLDEIVYSCSRCGAEVTRMVKRP
jgi:DNA-directed RNA polymerase subunit RPC12/RpoP